MGKDKFTVASFVKVMTGGKVELDESSKVARSNAAADLQVIDGMIAKLASLGVSSTQLAEARQWYSIQFSAASTITKKADQAKAFNTLAKAMELHVKAAKGPFPSWLALAQEQQRLKKAIDQTLNEKQGLVDKLPFAAVKTGLTNRIKGWRGNIVLATDVAGVPRAVAELKRLQVELGEGDIDRYFALAAQLDSLKSRLASEISAAEGKVDAVKPPELAKFVAKRLAEFKSRQAALNAPITDLFDLVNKCQGIGDLCDEVAQTDFAEIGNMVTRYTTVEKELRTQLQVDAAKLSKLPNLPFAKEIRQKIVDCLNKIQPQSQITGPSELATALKGIEKLVADYKDAPGSVDASIREANECQEWFDKMQAAYVAKRKEAEALPKSLVRDQILGSLSSLLKQAKPLAGMQSMAEVTAAASTNQLFAKQMDGFDIGGYDSVAKPYQAALSRFLGAHAQKAREVEKLPDGPTKDALRKSLKLLENDAVPVDQVTQVNFFPDLTTKVTELEERVRSIDVAKAARDVASYDQELAALKDKMDKKLAELGKGLSPDAQQLLRDEFADTLTPLTQLSSAQDAVSKIKQIREKAAEIERRKVEIDTELGLRLKKADDRVASTQKQIDKLPTPELKKAAQTALDDLKKRLNQVKIGSVPKGMAEPVLVGDPGKSGVLSLSPKPSEQTRAIDMAINALGSALADKSGTGVKMLEFLGGEELANGFCSMYATMTLSGSSHAGISPAEALAVNRYTGKDYKAMNLNRRGISVENKTEDARLTFLNKTCDEALAKMPPYPAVARPTFRIETAWSQEVVDKRYGRGRQFVCGVLWSTGARGVAAIGLTGSPIFTHVIYGNKGRDVAALSANSHEGATQIEGHDFNPRAGRGEVLFPADTSFVVKDRVDPVDSTTNAPKVLIYDPKGFGDRVTTTLKEVSNG
ncbi:hypothetical protein OEW28_14635 [Defluviimonas sp. WL0002]|uniref:Uncharacterized protein n=1 Tax=Albidovulum marisflavi TaxID=2984159 RepID=A0ABT2ZFP6_9RHOB|nr:hypothetical protein [Defluviimonas sp. WL0002]MCV2869868.1 hypothetical protein [Defluviimonas sp. WL0002]